MRYFIIIGLLLLATPAQAKEPFFKEREHTLMCVSFKTYVIMLLDIGSDFNKDFKNNKYNDKEQKYMKMILERNINNDVGKYVRKMILLQCNKQYDELLAKFIK